MGRLMSCHIWFCNNSKEYLACIHQKILRSLSSLIYKLIQEVRNCWWSITFPLRWKNWPRSKIFNSIICALSAKEKSILSRKMWKLDCVPVLQQQRKLGFLSRSINILLSLTKLVALFGQLYSVMCWKTFLQQIILQRTKYRPFCQKSKISKWIWISMNVTNLTLKDSS